MPEQVGPHAVGKKYGAAGITEPATPGSSNSHRDRSVALRLSTTLNVAEIRLSLPHRPYAVTQEQFARRFGFSPGAVRDWEQGRRKPDGAAQMLLSLIRHNHAAIEAAIQDMSAGVSKDATAG